MFVKRSHIELRIEGMSCGHCTSAVQRALKGVDGVRKVHVSLDEGSAKVTTTDDIDADRLITAVVEAGYEASRVE